MCNERENRIEFFETQAELANLPNSVKIKNPLNISKLNILIFISFWNVLNLN